MCFLCFFLLVPPRHEWPSFGNENSSFLCYMEECFIAFTLSFYPTWKMLTLACLEGSIYFVATWRSYCLGCIEIVQRLLHVALAYCSLKLRWNFFTSKAWEIAFIFLLTEWASKFFSPLLWTAISDNVKISIPSPCILLKKNYSCKIHGLLWTIVFVNVRACFLLTHGICLF